MDTENMTDDELLTYVLESVLIQSYAKREHLGFRYVVDATKLCYKNETLLKYKSKYLYKEVAKLNGITSYCVDKTIRDFLCKSHWQYRMLHILIPYDETKRWILTGGKLIDGLTAYAKFAMERYKNLEWV